ncbi:sensor histidine kinase [Peptoniphilus sp.]|uniref:sensor histidine kinase n=1 Tax=Peptoniphilus sp. TaxID=1971214 RepID=UPI003D89C154
MKNRIGKRLVKSFLIIILITISIIDIFLLVGFRYYYYNNISNELKSRLELSLDIYEKDFSNNSLKKLIYDDNQIFFSHTNAEVQILSANGKVLFDSIGKTDTLNLENINKDSFKKSNILTWHGKNPNTGESIMSVTGQILDESGNTIGYLKLISSLEDANRAIYKTMITLIFFTLIVAAITAVVSMIFSRSLVKPILELTDVANQMLDGNYEVRANIWQDDEIGELAKTLNSMSDEIINKDKIKNDFISSVSHELRTPLTSIKGWAVVLKDADKDEKELIDDGLNIIENEVDRLTKMVEDLLDFSRYISGRISLDKEIFNITKTCEDVAKQMKPRANNNKIELIVELTEEIELIYADENRIKQLLINLLDNAIKFTSENGWVKFQMYRKDDNIIILVSDNGVGMSKEDLAHVKEKFYKGKHSKSHSGIGLSISDEITNLHNGKLEIFSEENIGTTIKVTLPIENPKEAGEKEA